MISPLPNSDSDNLLLDPERWNGITRDYTNEDVERLSLSLIHI